MAPEQRERSQDVEENLELLGGHDLEGVGDVAQVLVVLQRGKEGALPVALGPVPLREPWGGRERRSSRNPLGAMSLYAPAMLRQYGSTCGRGKKRDLAGGSV